MSITSSTKAAEPMTGGVSVLRWSRLMRDGGDGRDDDLDSGQKTVTIVTTVTGRKK